MMDADDERAAIFHSDPAILDGTPVFVGTIVPVVRLIEWLEQGYALEEFIERFRTVERAQAVAFLRYATRRALAETGHAP
ncbi:MAG TPA: DUF433 domain-containing protein [Longimicrobium sp.]|nr:DUF433 domain-containing protein [Longimicrobium sp.]